MKYYIDFEFIEGFHKPLFGKRRHFIDMISVGIVCDDGREYYAISNEYRYKDANEWVQDNVIVPMYRKEMPWFKQQFTNIKTFHKYTDKSKSNKQISKDIWDFCITVGLDKNDFSKKQVKRVAEKTGVLITGDETPIEFYGYYSDYDWVLLCSLFGRMIDLPKGFPMYCRDLKQSLDEAVDNINQLQLSKFVVGSNTGKWTTSEIPKSIIDIKNWDKESKLELLKSQQGYPKQENEHNALADAKWNKKLHDFINSLTNV